MFTFVKKLIDMDGKLITDGNNNYSVLDTNNELVATTMQSGFNNQKLSIKNCEAIANGFDLDDTVDYFEKGKTYVQQDGVIILAGENGTNGIVIKDPLGTRGVGHYADNWNPKAFCEYNQKAIEILGDKKFTLEDIEVAMILMKGQEIFYETTFEETQKSREVYIQNYIKRVQKTEWNVEIIMIHGFDDIDNPKPFSLPKLDAHGCLILKKK